LVLAAVAVPVAWVTMEFLAGVRSRNGAWWSVAYSQAEHPAVLQVASRTGVWGVTALVLLPASAIGAAAAPAGTVAGAVSVLVAAAVLLAVVAAFAVRRMRTTGELLHVGLAVVPAGLVPIGSTEGRELAGRYLDKAKALAARGAQVVVLPEVTFT